MPPEFINEWCFEHQENNRVTWYQTPSATAGTCTKILIIDTLGFRPDDHTDCAPQTVKVTQDVAHSGTAYTANIRAKCDSYTHHADSDDTVVSTLRNYELVRYKASLSFTI